jgi:hypothetical protein
MRDRYCQQTCGQTTSAQVIRKIRFAACSDEVRKKSTACRRSLDACSDDVFKPSIAFLNWREARIWSSACPTSISGAGVGWVSFEPTPAAGAGVPAPGMLTGGSAGPAARNRSAKSAHPNKRSRRPPRPASLSGRCPDREGNVHEDAQPGEPPVAPTAISRVRRRAGGLCLWLTRGTARRAATSLVRVVLVVLFSPSNSGSPPPATANTVEHGFRARLSMLTASRRTAGLSGPDDRGADHGRRSAG